MLSGSDSVLTCCRNGQPYVNLYSNQMYKFIMFGIGIFTTIFVMFFVYAAYKYSRIFWCATVGFSNFNEVENNIFIDSALENSESERLLILINQAKSRITNQYGIMASSPVIIVVDSQINHNRYGLGPGRQTVRAYITPWGKYLVISSRTQDIDLLAHEYCHIEIAEQLGYLVFKTKLPVWLDEGLAMQVDYREGFRIENQPINPIEINRVKTLDRSCDFFTRNGEQTNRNIIAAKAAVYEILDQHSKMSLYDLFSKVRNGKDIADAY